MRPLEPENHLKPAYTAMQKTVFNIYQFLELPGIDPTDIAKKIRLVLEHYPRSDTENYGIPGFYTNHSKKFIKTDYFPIPEQREQTSERQHVVSVRSLFSDLIAAIEAKTTEICRANDLFFDHLNIKPEVEQFWCAVYQKGDKTEWHRHGARCCYNAVYYPVVEEDTPIYFEDMRNLGKIEVRPKPGMLLVFPGMTNHSVPEHKTDKTRMVFTASCVYKGGEI